MRSPVRGTHRAFPPRYFVTVPITSLKFWANIPTCFPNIFTVLSPLWILRMQRHAGKQGTCRCIPRSCIFRMLVIVNYELHHTKNRSKLDIARQWSHPIQISKPIGPEFFHTSTSRPQSLCLPIVPCADLSKCKKCEFCSVVFVVLFMSTSLTLALPLSQNFAQSWRTHQPNNSLLYLPKMVYSKANAPDQSLPETSKL